MPLFSASYYICKYMLRSLNLPLIAFLSCTKILKYADTKTVIKIFLKRGGYERTAYKA